MSTAMVSIENAPRDLQGLMQLKRTILFRLAHSLNMFADETQEAAFNQAPTDQMCQALLAVLQQHDAGQGTALPLTAQAPMPQAPVAAPAGYPPAPSAIPGAQIAMPPMPGQQVMPGVVAPYYPPAPAAPMAAPPMVAAPQVAPPQGGYLPPPIAMPPGAPMAAPQQPVRAPAFKAAPQAVVPPRAAPEIPVAPMAAPAGASQTLQIQQQVATTLQKLAETSQKTQEWLEQQQAAQGRLLSTILLVQLALAEQANIGAPMLAKIIKQMDPNAVPSFLEALAGGSGK